MCLQLNGSLKTNALELPLIDATCGLEEEEHIQKVHIH